MLYIGILLLYIGIKDKNDPEDIMQPIASNNNPIHYNSLEQALKMAKKWAAEHPETEVRIYRMTVTEDRTRWNELNH